MKNSIPIIDIFAGPGGLGEGFSAFKSESGNSPFKIKLSIEKDEFAHQTLELRAFFRQFNGSKVPSSYYEYLKGQIDRETLFTKHPSEAAQAKKEAWLAELGVISNDLIDARIRDALKNSPNWVLIGGPPCQAYSLVGRSRMRGVSEDEYERDPRHFLYKEYLRILAIHQPPVFIMENVKGLLSAKLQQKKTFELILADLRNPSNAVGKESGEPLSYKLFSVSNEHPESSGEIKPEDFIVRSEDYSIPQARHRIIIFGIRSDIYKSDPEILHKEKKHVSIDEVISDLPRLRSGLSKEFDSAQEWHDVVQSAPKAEWFKSMPTDFQILMIDRLKKVGSRMSRGKTYLPSVSHPRKHEEWFIDTALAGICNHETRGHIREDLYRYFFASVFAHINKRSPTLNDFPKELLPKHENVQEALDGSKFNDRFRVQVRGKPSTTVVSHISKDGHYYIHYDPTQCRSLTVREAARLQTFPDNYYFEGNRTQQYHQVGNAVPPLLAKKISEIVFNVIKNSK